MRERNRRCRPKSYEDGGPSDVDETSQDLLPAHGQKRKDVARGGERSRKGRPPRRNVLESSSGEED